MLEIAVPTINDTLNDFDNLFIIYKKVNQEINDISFTFWDCKFLQQNAIVFLGAIARLIQSSGKSVNFNTESMFKDIKQHLKKIGFLAAFDIAGKSIFKQINYIPYKEYLLPQNISETNFLKNEIVDYLKMGWLGSQIHLSDKLKYSIIGTVWEIYANAFEHSNSKIGIFCFWQYYKTLHLTKLSILDFGIGIPYNVNKYIKEKRNKEKELSSAAAMRWAFAPFTTTKSENNISRGLGLDLLKNFVKTNHGKLEVFSSNGYGSIEHNNTKYLTRSSGFEGTFYNITFKCDEKLYAFNSEFTKKELFVGGKNIF